MRRRDGAEEHDGRCPQRGGEMPDTGVAADDAAGGRNERCQREQVRSPRQDRRPRQAAELRDVRRERNFLSASRDDHAAAGLALDARDFGEALRRPPPRLARRSGVNQCGAAERGRHRHRRGVEVQVDRICRHAAFRQHPAPPRHFVLVEPPCRPGGALAYGSIGEGDQSPWSRRKQYAMALGSLAVKVDGDVGLTKRRVEGGARHGVVDGVDAAGVEGEWCERCGGGENAPVLGKGTREGTDRRDAGQEVTEAKRP